MCAWGGAPVPYSPYVPAVLQYGLLDCVVVVYGTVGYFSWCTGTRSGLAQGRPVRGVIRCALGMYGVKSTVGACGVYCACNAEF